MKYQLKSQGKHGYSEQTYKESSAQYLKSRLLKNFKVVGSWHWMYITYETLSSPSLKSFNDFLKIKPHL